MTHIVIFSIILIFLGLVSCQGPTNYGNSGTQQPTQGAKSGFGPNYTGNAQATSNSGCQHQKWGGVTCTESNPTNPHQFLEYLSNGTDTKNNSNSIGYINCQPSNNGGILFQMQVVLNAQFDPNGNNNNLTMQIASSSLEMIIYDDKSGHNPIGALFKGLSGEVNGSSARLTFDYTGQHGRKQLTLNGQFNSEVFEGEIHFENEKRAVAPQNKRGQVTYTNDGAKGLLGKFRIPTCHVFKSN